MLSPLATTLWTWTAIYAYVGVYYGMLFLRRRAEREHLMFALLCAAFVAWSAGQALAVDPHGARVRELALWLQLIGGFTLAPFFADFSIRLSEHPSRRAAWAGYAVACLAVLGHTAGLVFDPQARTLVALAGHASEPAFRLLGQLLAAASLAVAGWGLVILARRALRQPELRLLLAGASTGVVAAYWDIGWRIGGVTVVHLLEHAGLVPVLGVAYALLQRYVHASDELAASTAELRQSHSELRTMQEELVRKEQLAAVGELSAVIAHEVRNPLAIIKNAVSSMRRASLRPVDRGVLLNILDEEANRLNRLVRDLLAYARPVAPKGRAFDLKPIVEDVTGTLARAHPASHAIEVHLLLDDCPAIHGDPELLRQAITNVVDNSLQALSDGGALTVRASAGKLADRPAVVLEFSDTGQGMDTLVRSKAKDPFFTTRAAGTGLGLAIVERVIRNHGGSVSIESEPGEGTTVRMTLPRERPSVVPSLEENE